MKIRVALLKRLERLEKRSVFGASIGIEEIQFLWEPAVIGLSPPPAGPPPEIASDYLQRAGLKPAEPK